MPRRSRRQDFLDSARRLVQAQGFAATSVDAVSEQAGATKGAFFHYFRDKDELGVELLRHFRESGRAALRAVGQEQGCDARQRLRRYLAHLERMYVADARFRDGCLYAIFAYEKADPRSRVRRLCAAAIEEWLDAVATEFQAVLAMLHVRPAARPRELAELLLCTIEGALVVKRIRGGGGTMKRALSHFRRYVEAVMGV